MNFYADKTQGLDTGVFCRHNHNMDCTLLTMTHEEMTACKEVTSDAISV